MKTEIDGLEVAIDVMRARPGDLLVFKTARAMPQDWALHLKEQVSALVPDGVHVMVIGPDIDLSLLTTAKGAPR